MSINNNSRTVTDGLVMLYDANNVKSYVGPPLKNILTQITPTGIGVSTGYVATTGSETVNIPTLGDTFVNYVTIQNNYTSFTPNSTNCCPSLFQYGGGTLLPSTLYTYAIVYKCESGYTHPNFMYQYDYNGGAYVTEFGLHSTGQRIHLGGGWYWAWATFTTQSTVNTLNSSGLWYYQYSSGVDKVTVAKAMMVQGNYTSLHPKYWPALNTTRSTTQAVLDLTNNNTITATSLTYASDGTFSFNGSSNIIDATGSGFTSGMAAYTIMHWSKRDVENRMPISFRGGPAFYHYGDNSWYYTHGGASGEYYYPKSVSIPLGTWGFYCIVYNGINVSIYRNGVFEGSQATSGTADWSNGMKIGMYTGNGYYYQGKIDSVSFYNRALSAAEVQQNFQALRGRYGI